MVIRVSADTDVPAIPARQIETSVVLAKADRAVPSESR
jgi:hypothetical protein